MKVSVALYFTQGLVNAAVFDAMTGIKGSFGAHLNVPSYKKILKIKYFY